MKRRSRIRRKCVDTTYKECDRKLPYEVRNNYIEYKLEQRFKYFDVVNDLNTVGDEMETIRQRLAKVNAALK